VGLVRIQNHSGARAGRVGFWKAAGKVGAYVLQWVRTGFGGGAGILPSLRMGERDGCSDGWWAEGVAADGID
jgi:hypothetical protein